MSFKSYCAATNSQSWVLRDAPRQVHPSKPPLRACQSARPDLTSDANKFRNWSWLVICPPMFSYSTTRQLRRKQPLSQCEHFDEAMSLCRFCLETGAWRPQVPKRYTTKSVEQPCGQPKQPRQRKTSSPHPFTLQNTLSRALPTLFKVKLSRWVQIYLSRLY
jgi:hypothetical protein